MFVRLVTAKVRTHEGFIAWLHCLITASFETMSRTHTHTHMYAHTHASSIPSSFPPSLTCMMSSSPLPLSLSSPLHPTPPHLLLPLSLCPPLPSSPLTAFSPAHSSLHLSFHCSLSSPLLTFPFLGDSHRDHSEADRDSGANARREIPVSTVRNVLDQAALVVNSKHFSHSEWRGQKYRGQKGRICVLHSG
jgi:hypothetical protein